jgi:phosphate uptake regulator
MFSWFKSITPSASDGLGKMTSEFGHMLDAGRHCFDVAANALLGGTDPEVIRKDLFSTDRSINEAEQNVRRHLVVHVSVHGAASLPACLVLMTVVKDAERIGDYAKNIFDLTPQASAINSDAFAHGDLVELKDAISAALAKTRKAFDSQDEDEARALVRQMNEMEDRCDQRVEEILASESEHSVPATLVLAYRYFKRVVSHAMNITTSIFMPLDKIDYFDEKPRPEIP